MNDMNECAVCVFHLQSRTVLYSTVPTAAAAAPLLYRACNLCQACTRTHSSDSTATTQQHKDVKSVSQSASQCFHPTPSHTTIPTRDCSTASVPQPETARVDA